MALSEVNPTMDTSLGRYVAIGETATVTRVLTANDIAAFAALSGDFDPIHVDEAYAAGTAYGRRIAHGLGVLALVSGLEAELSRRVMARGAPLRPVSLGYDAVRFLRPVFVGDTLLVSYRVTGIDEERRRSTAAFRVEKADGELCLVGEHVMTWIA